MKMKKQIQFELWPDCNTRCKFCYLCNQTTDNEFKLKAIDYAFNKLSSVSKEEFETIGFIGGEFFQGQLNSEIKESFMKLMLLSNDLLSKGYVDNLWLTSSMIIGDQSDLYAVLDLLKNNLSKVWVLTSYDTIGRFHTQQLERNWKNNVCKLKQLYPNVNLNVTMILTKHLMDKYLENQIDFEEFKKLYNCDLYFKAPDLQRGRYKSNLEMNSYIPSFFPDRDTAIKFFVKMKQNDYACWNKLFDINYRADILIKNINEEVIRDKTNYNELYNNEDHLMKCGHFYSYNSYVQENGCILCDKLQIDRIGADNE